MPTVRTDEASIHWLERGTGPPLVLLPGLGYDHTTWEPQIERFASDHRVIAIDPRGSGGSSRLRGGRILPRQAADIAAVLDHLGVERAMVCGVSYGGVPAQRFALDFPYRAAGLITVDSFSDTRPRSFGEGVNLVLLYAMSWLWLFPALMRPAVRRQYARWPEARDRLVEGLKSLRPWETVKIRYALNGVHHTTELSELRCPVLVVVGDSPALIPLSQRIVDAVPHARLAVIEDSFDPSNLCRPERFDAVLGAFLEEHEW